MNRTILILSLLFVSITCMSDHERYLRPPAPTSINDQYFGLSGCVVKCTYGLANKPALCVYDEDYCWLPDHCRPALTPVDQEYVHSCADSNVTESFKRIWVTSSCVSEQLSIDWDTYYELYPEEWLKLNRKKATFKEKFRMVSKVAKNTFRRLMDSAFKHSLGMLIGRKVFRREMENAMR